MKKKTLNKSYFGYNIEHEKAYYSHMRELVDRARENPHKLSVFETYSILWGAMAGTGMGTKQITREEELDQLEETISSMESLGIDAERLLNGILNPLQLYVTYKEGNEQWGFAGRWEIGRKHR